MDKEQSTIIKGIAILMMLWFHLFGIDELEQVCTPLIHINGKAFVTYLSNASYPVSFFLILSGYGLTYIFKQKRLNIIDQSKRLLKLYIHYWIILLVFVGLSVFVKPGMYDLDFLHIIGNITAIKCNYNGEAWFLFPYVLLTLSSPFTINYIYNLHQKKTIIITILFYISLFMTAKYLSDKLPENIVLNTIILQYYYYVILLFYFTLGILLYILLERNIHSCKSIYYLFSCPDNRRLVIPVEGYFRVLPDPFAETLQFYEYLCVFRAVSRICGAGGECTRGRNQDAEGIS